MAAFSGEMKNEEGYEEEAGVSPDLACASICITSIEEPKFVSRNLLPVLLQNQGPRGAHETWSHGHAPSRTANVSAGARLGRAYPS